MAASQLQGFTTANILEIEANTRAARMTLRAEDYGSLGIYSLSNASGVMAAGLGAAAPVYSARWTDAAKLALIKRVTIGIGADSTSFGAAAASGFMNMFVARSFSASDSSGTSILPSGNQNKLRTSMGTTLFGDIRISSTATLTAGTRTLDTNPAGTLVYGVQAGAGISILYPIPIFDQRPGEFPLILAQNEGIVIQATMPGTGTWRFSVKLDWTEIASY